MALIPPFFLDCVVAIGVRSPDPSNPIFWVGTGFVVGDPITESDRYYTYLVTNKHVLINKTKIVLRFNSTDRKSSKDFDIDLFENGMPIWAGHPSSDVDVAVFRIDKNALNEDDADCHFFALDKHSLTTTDMRQEGVSEGDGIFILGFPMGIVDGVTMHAIARNGIVARIRDTLNGSQKCFLVDANVFPGNSGGPVVNRPELTSIQDTKSIQKSSLIGIVKSYVPYKDVAISQQTGNTRVIFEENSGLALVETVDSIKEAIQECEKLLKAASTPNANQP